MRFPLTKNGRPVSVAPASNTFAMVQQRQRAQRSGALQNRADYQAPSNRASVWDCGSPLPLCFKLRDRIFGV